MATREEYLDQISKHERKEFFDQIRKTEEERARAMERAEAKRKAAEAAEATRKAASEASVAVVSRSRRRYLTRIPGRAPASGASRKIPGVRPSLSEAARTIPSERPNFIFRGARLATMTVIRPTSVAGS